jgi:cell division septation protein DedD
VVFHAVRNGQNDGNLEVKTDPDGKAAIDVIEIGSQVTVQVIANGFATYASDIAVDSPTKELLVKLQRPKAQVSDYEDNDSKPAPVTPSSIVQEHVVPKPASPPAAPPAPVTKVPPAPNGTPQ